MSTKPSEIVQQLLDADPQSAEALDRHEAMMFTLAKAVFELLEDMNNNLARIAWAQEHGGAIKLHE